MAKIFNDEKRTDINAEMKKLRASLYKAASYSNACVSTWDPAASLSTGAWTDKEVQDAHVSLLEHAYLEDDFYAKPTELKVESVHPGESGKVTAHYDRLLAVGYIDELRGLLVIDEQCWGRFSLFRRDGEMPFSDSEITAASEVAKKFAPIFRETISRFSLSPPAHDTSGIFICSRDHQVLWKDEDGAAVLEELRKIENIAGENLPSSVLSIIIQLQEQPKGTVSLLVRRGADQGFLRMKGTTVKGIGNLEAVSIIVQSADEKELRKYKEQSFGFTIRESEVLGLLLAGDTTNQVAQKLYISPYTVLDHCKSLLQKSGSPNRKQLMRLFL